MSLYLILLPKTFYIKVEKFKLPRFNVKRYYQEMPMCRKFYQTGTEFTDRTTKLLEFTYLKTIPYIKKFLYKIYNFYKVQFLHVNVSFQFIKCVDDKRITDQM